MWRVNCFAGLCLLALAACKNGTVHDEQAAPARISEPSSTSRAEIQNAIREALGRDVALAENALSDSSVLIVERQARRDPPGNRLPGRDLDAPEHFELWLRGDTCVLVHRGSGESWELTQSVCEPES